MARYKIKGLPPIKLIDLLKKRRITLQKFIKDSGMNSYQTLLSKCEKMGVSAPGEAEFREAVGGIFSSPQEGVIVLEPPDLTKDSGEKVKVDCFIDHEIQDVVEEPTIVELPTTSSKSYKRSKKSSMITAEVVDVTFPVELELK